METFEHLRRSRTVLLTTRRRDGRTVDTPINLAIDSDGEGYFQTWTAAGKAKRLNNFPGVRVAPCSPRGKPKGSDQPALATRLSGADAELAVALLTKRHPIAHGLVVPRSMKLRKLTPVCFRLTPVEEPTPWEGLPAPGAE